MADSDLEDFLGEKPRTRWQRWRWWIVAIVVLVVLVLLLSRCMGGSDAPKYATAKAETGRLVTTVSATGNLAPTNQVTVGAQLSGQIVRVLVDVNDRVTKGQVLAEIDPEQIDDQIRQGEATINANVAAIGTAKATLAENTAQLARQEEVYRLSGGKVPSGTEMQTARADVQRAKAALAQAVATAEASRASLAQTKTQRTYAVIRSPVSGVVLARQVDPGQTVASSFSTPTLFVIAEDLSKMKLEVSIDEADVGTVKDGQKATFTVDAFPSQTFDAQITRVEIGSNLTVSSSSSSSSSSTTSSTSSSSSSGQVVSYAADLSVANNDLKLRPGMTATADIVTSDKANVLMIPNTALRFKPAEGAGASGGFAKAILGGPPRRGGATDKGATIGRGSTQTIYVLGKKGEPQAVEIVTGNTDGTNTEVVSGGLKPGMQVITGTLSAAGSAAAGAKGG
ncbi:efflux RND transporter periplasmic adaptor subunit [Novosphingobium sp. 9]|uniref:efflux RND transporter periplasmic adaptor subunit n=1 Tax=Novosphingobium sp. 9 TaxID=2025349 RepID=UPI0021B62089